MKFANSTGNQANILLVTINSSYAHAAFGLRYLYANLGEMQKQARILEFTIDTDSRSLVEELIKTLPSENSGRPCIVGFGVYIWNAQETLQAVSLLKKVRPDICIVLGGPEVSYESETQELCQIADCVIAGEADFSFREFCRDYFSDPQKPRDKFIQSPLPNITEIKSPYAYYTDEDVKNRVIYVEASRGCPYKCEYCLSSLDKSVRNFNLEAFLADLQSLINQGVRQFKFIDRTFNLSPTISTRILQFFLDRIDLGLFLHFEMVPDRLPQEIRDLIQKFPLGSLQFEIGIQTLNPEVAKLVSRKNDLAKVAENFLFLREHTEVHTHADLIAGLPGESLQSFADGFDRLFAFDPDEIQVGILKRLKGTPIIRHDQEWQMHYSSFQPFEVLKTKTMSFQELQKVQQFSKHWDWIANSGRYKIFLQTLKDLCQEQNQSIFWKFMELSDFIFAKHSVLFGMAPQKLRLALREYAQKNLHLDPIRLDEIIPEHAEKKTVISPLLAAAPKRQQQHSLQ